MGRIRRQRRYKPCDPFSKQKANDEKFDLPPKGEDDHFLETKSFRYFQDKIEKAGTKRKSDIEDLSDFTSTKAKITRKSDQVEVPPTERLPNESRKKYFARLDQNVQVAINAAMKETKSIRKKRKDHLKHRDQKKKKQKANEAHQVKDFESLKDEVKFGEVAKNPPVLSAIPRKASREMKLRDLKLISLLNTKSAEKSSNDVIKRKDMSLSEKQAFDHERQKAINAYRLIKKRKEAELKYQRLRL